MMEGISGTTKVIAIFGWPVEHSLSPAMHNAAFQEMGLDFCYVAFPIRPEGLAAAVDGAHALGLHGMNITVPHKEAIMPLLDKVSPESSFIGAANTVVLHNTKLVGHNTDGRGFMRSLEEEGIEAKDKRVLLLGSGGASRAVAWALGEAGAGIHIHSRNNDTASRLVHDLSINFKGVQLVEDLEDAAAEADIVLNATPLGLKQNDPLPIDLALIKDSQVAIDLIYKPTPFLEAAREKGCRALDGRGMLLWQGVLASEIWTGQVPPVETMRKVLFSTLERA